jgi:hypothetical protein
MNAKPSEHLKEKGWRPVHPGWEPRDTTWVDPLTGDRVTFVYAVYVQSLRDARS